MQFGDGGISWVLSDRTIGKRKVVGLAGLNVFPTGVRLGTKALEIVKSLAHPRIVVGFSGEDTLPFYRKSGWIVGRRYRGADGIDRYMVSSKPVDETAFDGDTW